MRAHLLIATAIVFFLFQLGTAGEGFWETNGPYGGEMLDVEYGGVEGLCYVGGEGGFYASLDGGATWEKRTPDLPAGCYEYGIYCLRVSACPAQPGLVYAGFTNYETSWAYKSQDAGVTWERMVVPTPSVSLSAVACDPHDPDRVFVAYSEGGG